MQVFWTWLIHTDGGLLARIAVGAVIFTILAIVDIRRHGPHATRWREYLFLLAAAGVAMVYGAANDLITSRISWEYFYYGKELYQTLGPATPPDPHALAWAAAGIGIKATWSAGLIAAVVLLIANNPKPGLPQIAYPRLGRLLLGIFLACAVCGAIFGAAGRFGFLVGINADFGEMTRRHEMRPQQFMTAFGVHLGGYAGGVIGAIGAAVLVRKARQKAIGRS